MGISGRGVARQASKAGSKCLEKARKKTGWVFLVVPGWAGRGCTWKRGSVVDSPTSAPAGSTQARMMHLAKGGVRSERCSRTDPLNKGRV